MLHSAQHLSHVGSISQKKERGGSKVQNRFTGQIFHAGAWQHSREAPKICICALKGTVTNQITVPPPPPRQKKKKMHKVHIKVLVMNSDDAWQCNGHPRASFMHHLALCFFCAEHGANCYDVAVELWMLTCANIISSQRLQAEIMPGLKFPVGSHFMALRWRGCSPAASETTKNQSRADVLVSFFLARDPNINPFALHTSEQQR